LVTRQYNPGNLEDPLLESRLNADRVPLDEATFTQALAIERKRTERTRSPFLLMLLEVEGDGDNHKRSAAPLITTSSALMTFIRDTDLIGWYKDRQILGVIYTGLDAGDKRTIFNTFWNKLYTVLRAELPEDLFNRIRISFHIFPDDWENGRPGNPSNATLYPDLTSNDSGNRMMLLAKRLVDIAGSCGMLVILSPLFLVIALAIKLTSKGPVLFRQQRVGRLGKTFVFLKFRSMYVNNDTTVHEVFVKKMIASEAQPQSGDSDEPVFKIVNDKRITPLGRFLRRTSLDELPQFLNVLKGEMSLVGPRPPIPYELAAYKTWHRQRLLAVKPGITGLWQVTCRSTVQFDDMVRLDLRYASLWSLWLDLKILLRTPAAVVRGSGAH
jgi:lipopolysaccharide/colanic/teichoic acid biosynthesis glycosyltransferase